MDESVLPKGLSETAIVSLPERAYYVPNFITSSEEEFLLHKVNTAPVRAWRHLSRRRLQTYPSPLTSQNTLPAAPLPVWLSELVIKRLLSIPVSSEIGSGHVFLDSPHQTPNHVLVNEYTAGQGIFPHEDGAAYHPVVATVSLGSHIVLDIYKKKPDGSGERGEEPSWKILQEPRSLLITTGKLYEDYLHGIAEVIVDKELNRQGIVNWDMVSKKEDYGGETKLRGTRVSLTLRDVLNVTKLGKGLQFLGKKVV